MEVEGIAVQFLCLYLSLSTAVIHSLQYFTVTSEMTNFPDYIEIEMVDGSVVSRYDSKSQQKVPMQPWMKTHIDQQYWVKNTMVSKVNEQIFKTGFQTVKSRFNHIEGGHTYQEMYGCKWDNDTETTDGYKSYGYDGEDFLSLDLKTMRWNAHVPQAAAIRDEREANEAELMGLKHFFTFECTDKLKKYVSYTNSPVESKVIPKVTLLKRKDRAVVCLATGFHPKTLQLTWMRNKQEMSENVEKRETLPNADGTFQKRCVLTIPPGKRWKYQYTCALKDKSGLIVEMPLEDVIHSLQYFTVTSDIPSFPDYIESEMVDGTVVSRYDSKSQQKVPMQPWMETHFDQQYWEKSTIVSKVNEQFFKTGFQTVKKHFNHTEGRHTYQEMYGCQWDHDAETTDGHKRYGYDGEDFLSLDLKTMRWNAHVPQAAAIRDDRDANEADRAGMKLFFNHECIDKLKEYVGYGKSHLGRKVPPVVSVLKRGEHAVVCHATGFYPDTLMITWRRNGEELYDDMNVGEMLPNEDGTFQKRVEIKVSLEDRKRDRFACEVEHESVEPVIVIFEEEENSHPISLLITVTVIVIVLICLIISCAVLRKKKDYRKATASDGDYEMTSR